MLDLSNILKDRIAQSNTLKERVANQNKNLHSELHYWADTISKAFGEHKKFGMYLGIIKRIGVSDAKRIFAEIKDSNCKSPAKLFVWKTKKQPSLVLPVEPIEPTTTQEKLL